MATREVRRKRSLLARMVAAVWGREQPALLDDPCASTWAREVKCYGELPEIYQPPFGKLLSHRAGPFPYTVVMPTFKGGSRRPQTERLVFKLGREIHVLVDSEGGLGAARYPIESIEFVERGSILLHAWITICGQDSEGELRSTTLRFNAVTDHIMAPLIEAMRAPAACGSSADLAGERRRFDFLGASHFKFMSYAKASIRPGARVIQCAFQPERRSKLIRLFSISVSRLESPAHLAILTDSELILIRDDATQRWSKGPPHGAIWTYIPRRQITNTWLSSGSNGMQTLSLTLRAGSRFDVASGPSQSRNLGEIAEALRSPGAS